MNARPGTTTLPALFVGHGSPMNAIEDNAVTRGWRELAATLPRPRAILCVSAHWETRGTWTCDHPHPPTIHDFHGFPKALFDVRYPAPGDPALARQVAGLVRTTSVATTPDWGLDHGAWSVLRVMYPQADMPVVQLSLDTSQPGSFHAALGRELAPLRDDGVLIVGSGNIVHNLRLYDFRDPTPQPWAVRADALLRERIVAGDLAALADWRALGADVALAVPTPEHFLPLLYVLGARRDGEPLRLFDTIVESSLAMTGVVVG